MRSPAPPPVQPSTEAADPKPEVTPKRATRSIFESVALLAESSRTPRERREHPNMCKINEMAAMPSYNPSHLTPDRVSTLATPLSFAPPSFVTPPYTPYAGSRLHHVAMGAAPGAHSMVDSGLATPSPEVRLATPDVRPRSCISVDEVSNSGSNDGRVSQGTPPYTPMRFDNSDVLIRSLVLSGQSQPMNSPSCFMKVCTPAGNTHLKSAVSK